MKAKNLEIFERYYNHQMKDIEREQFEKELAGNESLRKDYEEYKEVYEAIGDKDTIELRRQLRKIGMDFREGEGRRGRRREMNSWVWLAALLIISISIISVTYMLVHTPLTGRMLGMREGYRNIVGQIYRLEPAYAEIMRYRIRSEDFHLESPRDSIVVERRSDITFRWNTTIEQPLILDILDKNGVVIHSFQKQLTSPFIFSKNIHAGIYVFRFRTNIDTIYYGLFYVV